MMMNSDLMGYRIDWLKKVKVLDAMTEDVLNETDPTYEMKRKHEALDRKFQLRFCQLFNDMFGAGFVETTGWTFLYPLVAQHEPCTREDSGVYVVHYILEFTGLYLQLTLTPAQLEDLRKKIAYEIVTMKGNKGDIPDFLYEEILD